jgi:D-arabinose 1-dehydrogenase-like Zn-dependent alcohol dehydrogenase
MKAAAMEGYRTPLVLRDLPDPPLPAHGARVAVQANGICRSDWHTWVGDWGWMGAPPLEFPFVLGHEFCGIVLETGPDCRLFSRGDRVIVPFSQGEGSCEQCLGGNHHLCDAGPSPGWTYWGGYGERVAVPHADINLVRLPDSIGFVEGASLGCRFMTSFHGLVDRAQVRPGEWVAVHGCGGIGLAAVQIAAAAGCHVIAVDIDPAKLEAARAQGAVAIVNASSEDAPGAVRELTRGGAEVAVDALGGTATCRNSVLSLQARPSSANRADRGRRARRHPGADRLHRDEGVDPARQPRHGAAAIWSDAEARRTRRAAARRSGQPDRSARGSGGGARLDGSFFDYRRGGHRPLLRGCAELPPWPTEDFTRCSTASG